MPYLNCHSFNNQPMHATAYVLPQERAHMRTIRGPTNNLRSENGYTFTDETQKTPSWILFPGSLMTRFNHQVPGRIRHLGTGLTTSLKRPGDTLFSPIVTSKSAGTWGKLTFLDLLPPHHFALLIFKARRRRWRSSDNIKDQRQTYPYLQLNPGYDAILTVEKKPGDPHSWSFGTQAIRR